MAGRAIASIFDNPKLDSASTQISICVGLLVAMNRIDNTAREINADSIAREGCLATRVAAMQVALHAGALAH
jgi:hypothetical protein